MAEGLGTPAAQPHAHLHPATSASASAASAASRALAGLVGMGCAALTAWLALHHPLSPPLALAGIALLAAGQAAWRPGPRQDAGRASRRMRAWGLLLLWTASVLVAMQRGALDAGGWAFSWWQGLHEPLNALGLAKPTLAVLLPLPLCWRLQQRPGQRCADQLSLGLARSPPALATAGLLLLGGIYAGLTTFSRTVCLALPVGALRLWWLQRRQGRAAEPQAVPERGSAAILLLASLLAGLGVWLFRSAGVTHRPP